jgi:hypothetical protein
MKLSKIEVRKNLPDIHWEKKALERQRFFSQFGKHVAEKLGYKRSGIFLNVGAADGIDMSNTYYFEKELQ